MNIILKDKEQFKVIYHQINDSYICECNFKNKTGYPCEHQLLSTIKKRDTLLKLINPKLIHNH